MSLKKATPKAVFEACEQLELLDQSWNRDDVRLNVGGGSFSVIDPLIQAWRKMQPVREVAPSLPVELLLQVAALLEQQVSGYIQEVDERDQARESSLLQAGEDLANNLQNIEARLTDQLDIVRMTNNDLEAECSRLEGELRDKAQENLTLTIRLASAEENVAAGNKRFNNQQAHYENSLAQIKQNHEEILFRTVEKGQQESNDLKHEHKESISKQLNEQKNQLIQAAEVAENRLMQLIDRSRTELKEVQLAAESKCAILASDLQASRQGEARIEMELAASKGFSLQLERDSEQVEIQQKEQQSKLKAEISSLRSQLDGRVSDNSELAALKASIQFLHQKIEGRN